MNDSEIEKNDGIKNTIENQIFALENSIINTQVFKSIQAGNTHIKNTHNGINIDNMDELMDDIVEQSEISQSISDIFTQRVNSVYEDDELLAELTEYTDEPKPITVILPEVPKQNFINVQHHNNKKKEQEEEEDTDETELQQIRLAMMS